MKKAFNFISQIRNGVKSIVSFGTKVKNATQLADLVIQTADYFLNGYDKIYPPKTEIKNETIKEVGQTLNDIANAVDFGNSNNEKQDDK